MKVLRELAVKNLRLNKRKTTVTIIGIILSSALITGVITLLSSFQTSMHTYIQKTYGNYHYAFQNVSMDTYQKIQQNSNIETSYVTQNIGYSFLEKEGENTSIQLLGFSEKAMEELGIKLLEGNFPKQQNEIVISNKINENGNTHFTIGSSIEVELQNEMQKSIKKQYTIVGIVEITDLSVETFDSNYYTMIGKIDKSFSMQNWNIYVRFQDVTQRIKTIAQILNVQEKELENWEESIIRQTEENIQQEASTYPLIINDKLMAVEMGIFHDQTSNMIYAVGGILLFLLMITSVHCIKNSFQISITEKIKQYGMLASIGATSKQIKKSIFYEAFYLGLVGIPIGVILGIFTIYALLKITEQLAKRNLFGMEFLFSTNFLAIIAGVLFSIVTIYLSARKIAKKVSKIVPLEAIKASKDIKINIKKIKAPKWIKKFFGVGGDIAYKNLKRNKKQYRPVVLSIVVSVACFIAMSSFTIYAFELTNIYYKNYKFDIAVFGKEDDSLRKIAQDDKIETYEWNRSTWANVQGAEEHYAQETKYMVTKNNYQTETILIESLGQEEYLRFLKKLGLSYENAKDKGILLDYKTDEVKVDGKTKNAVFRMYDYQAGDTISIYQTEEEIVPIELIAVTRETPLGLTNSNMAYLVVSDEWIDAYFHKIGYHPNSAILYIQTQQDELMENYIKENYENMYLDLWNVTKQEREENSMYITISIFLYTFIFSVSCIGITSIFNTITTSMQVRQREFASLKAIGMTKKEFHRMIRLESMFYTIKALCFGIPLGILASYSIYLAFQSNLIIEYIVPVQAIGISILAVFLILLGMMKYTTNKINQQNIIETIRKESI